MPYRLSFMYSALTFFFKYQSKFFWNHLIESEVRKMFCKCAATKLIDMISRVKERGKQPYWILDDYYKDLVAYWGTDKAKEKSKKASKSRMSDRAGWDLINTDLAHVHMLGLPIYW